MKKHHRQRQRLRQKISQKTIIIVGVSLAGIAIIGITVFLSVSRVDQLKATENGSNRNVIVFPEQKFTTEKSLPAIQLDSNIKTIPNAVYAKRAKRLLEITPVVQ